MTFTLPTQGISANATAQLRRACGGAAYFPGDPGYDAARAAWQANVDQQPAAVVHPVDALEVAEVVRVAAAHGLRVAAQGTGHNASPLPSLEKTVLVRTSALTDVTIDRVARRARVGSGAVWADVTDAAAEAGLAALHGSSPDVGVAGYSLGGGMGWYARKLGLQTNALTAVELVTADGRIVRADAENEPELFWALRGGGGNFGVVTTLEFELFEITSAYAGWLVWDWTRAGEVLPTYLRWAAESPDEVTTSFRILRLPPIEDVPEPLRGRDVVAIDGAVLADDTAAAELLAPLRALRPELDTFTRMAAVDLCRLHGDPEQPTPVMSDSAIVDVLAPEDIDGFAEAFVGAAGADAGSSLMIAELRQLGGAVGRPAPNGGAVAMMPGSFVLFGAGIPMAPGHAELIAADAARLVEACRPWSTGRRYLNFAERAGASSAGYDPSAWQRLTAARAKYDPDRIFLANHEI
jgi:FAD/FMN-containing dehydrogenase